MLCVLADVGGIMAGLLQVIIIPITFLNIPIAAIMLGVDVSLMVSWWHHGSLSSCVINQPQNNDKDSFHTLCL